MNKEIIFIGLGIVFIYFVIHLAIINDYGLSWDFHAHFYSGLYHLGLPYEKIKEYLPPPSSTIVDYSSLSTLNSPFGPIISIAPTLSYILFHDMLHLFPFDSAYNFFSVVSGVLGVGVLFFFIAESINIPTAFLGAVFLALIPNYFGYLHTNMKDIPNAGAMALGTYLFWRLVKNGRVVHLLLAVFAFAVAFNTKINSFIVPGINFLWYVFVKIKSLFKKKLDLAFFYFVLAPIAALAVWWPFWTDPWGKLWGIPTFFSTNTLFTPVLLGGVTYWSAINLPWYYPYAYLAITTQIPLLVFFLCGLVVCIKKVKENNVYLLFLLWFFLPLARFFLPNVSAIDGVRHFMEVLFPLAAIAGIGAMAIYLWIKRIVGSKTGLLFIFVALFLISYPIVHYHPYQTSYFNELVGGIRGANGKYDIDFWGTPQKEVMLWLNTHAFRDASISIPMAGDTAGLYLRNDLYKHITFLDFATSDYTVVLNRQTFLDLYQQYHLEDFLKQKMLENKIVHTVTIDGVPLVWVIKK